MDPIDVTATIVQVAEDVDEAPGQFHLIENMTAMSPDHGSEDPAEVRVFGRVQPHVRGGRLTTEFSLDGLWTPQDWNGQEVLRRAYEEKLKVWIQYLHDGEHGYRQRATVTSMSDPSEADGDYVGVSFTLRGIEGSRVWIQPES